MSIKKSFSLIEVLIFITILSFFFVTSAAIITVSMHQNTLKINMLKASHYNEQLLDWIKGEKDTNWNDFVLTTSDKTFCFKTDEPSWLEVILTKDDCDITLGGIFRRYAVFKTDTVPSTQVQVTTYTEWEDGGNTYSTKLYTVLNIWE
ncbi:MAG: hypothetical protein NTV98_04975 [Candidatus Roizmanbacteria bacterium]|nr:hypothetical protein [Candidatus Roizmanbacteria bacterium]